MLPVEEDGGTPASRERLTAFVRKKLARYADGRNEPDDPSRTPVSGLSGYLRHGHVGVEEVIAEALGTNWTPAELNLKARYKDDFFCRDPNVNGFLDETITWRDLGFHWHFCRDRSAARVAHHSGEGMPAFNFETMDFSPLARGTLETVLPEWAKAQHAAHAGDRREFVYTPEEFEAAATHDDLWNAAQRQLVATGRIHNYLRMVWGKKVLEWSASAEEAYRVLEHLNNKYAVDGREPNSYTNILWCFGLFDRPWPPDRPVFGNIRFMSSANTAKKYDLSGYYEYVRTLPGGAGKTGTGRLF